MFQRNPADYEANVLPKHSESRTDRARHYREKLLDNAARRHTSPAGSGDSGEDSPSKKAAREYRIKRRSLNLEQQKVLGESVAGNTVRGGSAENLRSPRSSPRASPLASPRTTRIGSWKAGRLSSLGDSSSIQRTSPYRFDSLDKDYVEAASKNTRELEQGLSKKDYSVFGRESLVASDDHKDRSEVHLIDQELTNPDESSQSNALIPVQGLLFEDISGSETSSGISVICDTSTSISQPLSPVDSGSVFDADKSDALDDLVFLEDINPKEESQNQVDTKEIDLGYSTLKENSISVNNDKLAIESESHLKTSENKDIKSTSSQSEDLEDHHSIETRGFDSDIDSGNNSGSETPPPLPDSAPPRSESLTPNLSTLQGILPDTLSENSAQLKLPEKLSTVTSLETPQQSSIPEKTSQSTFHIESAEPPSQQTLSETFCHPEIPGSFSPTTLPETEASPQETLKPVLPEKLSEPESSQRPSQVSLVEEVSKPVIPETYSKTSLQTLSQPSSQDNQGTTFQPVLLIDSHQLTSNDSSQTTLLTREKTNSSSTTADQGPTSEHNPEEINLPDTNCPPPLPSTAPPLSHPQCALPCVKDTSVLLEKVDDCSDCEFEKNPHLGSNFRDFSTEEKEFRPYEKCKDYGMSTDSHLLKESSSSSNCGTKTGCEASANCETSTHSTTCEILTDINIEQHSNSGVSLASISANHFEDAQTQNYTGGITDSEIITLENQQPEKDFSFRSKQEATGDSRTTMEGNIVGGLEEEVVVAEHRSRQYTLPQEFIPVENAPVPHPIPPPRRRSKTDKQRKPQTASQENGTADREAKLHTEQEVKAEEVVEEEIVTVKRESTKSEAQIEDLLNSIDANKSVSGDVSDSDISDEDGRGNSSQSFQLNQTDTSNTLPDFTEDYLDDGITLVCYETSTESSMVSGKLSANDNIDDCKQTELGNEFELTPAVYKVNMSEALPPTRHKGEESLERGRDFAEKVQPKYVIRKQSSGGSSHNLSSEDLQEMLQERQAVINQTTVLRRTTDWSDWKLDNPAAPSKSF